MEKSPHPSPSSSPNSTSSSNGTGNALPPKSLQPVANPYPTTFVQADTHSFRQVVQMLTGSAETAARRANPNPNPKNPIPPPLNRAKKPAFKLYERRPSMKNLKMIGPLLPSFMPSINQSSPMAARSPLSPSVLDFPSLALSPVTPLLTAEERAIAEKGFYLHPSPRAAAATQGPTEPPRLLPLFPVTSPRDSN